VSPNYLSNTQFHYSPVSVCISHTMVGFQFSIFFSFKLIQCTHQFSLQYGFSIQSHSTVNYLKCLSQFKYSTVLHYSSVTLLQCYITVTLQLLQCHYSVLFVSFYSLCIYYLFHQWAPGVRKCPVSLNGSHRVN
jgi:hypothetical protein